MSVALPREHRYTAGPASNGASPPMSPALKDRFSQHHHLTHASLPPAAGSYLSVDNKISTNSRSFLNLTTSALSGVFGSQTSLAELAGDESTNTASGKNGDNNYPAIEKVSNISTTTPGGTPKSIDNYDSFLDDANRSLTKVMNGTVIKKRRGSMSFPNSAVSATRRQTTTLTRHATLPAMTPNNKLVRLSFNTLLIRIITLFGFGVGFGELARHLHDNHEVTPHTLDISLSDNNLATYSLVWGAQGIVLGLLFPFFDWLFPEDVNFKQGKSGSDWSSIIRAVSAFLGLGLGVRKLPWDSSEQVAALWGLLNPFLWYLFDGSRNGFILSTLVAVLGTLVFAVFFPSHLPQAELSSMYVSVAAWIASVYFCCSICFGNIGRRILSVEVSTVRQ